MHLMLKKGICFLCIYVYTSRDVFAMCFSHQREEASQPESLVSFSSPRGTCMTVSSPRSISRLDKDLF